MNSINIKLFLSIFVISISNFAFAGGSDPGGGDRYTLDFINTVQNEVYPWLKLHGSELNPAVDADKFMTFVNPQKIDSLPEVFESCDKSGKPQSESDRSVTGCLSASGMIHLSQKFYPLDVVDSPMKRNFIMHEIFRKMGIEGDGYEQTRTISRFQVLPSKAQACIINLSKNTSLYGEKAINPCERSGSDDMFQACVINLYHNAGLYGEQPVRACERSGSNDMYQACVINLYHNAGLNGEQAVRACERSGSDDMYQSCVINLYRNGGLNGEQAVSACRSR